MRPLSAYGGGRNPPFPPRRAPDGPHLTVQRPLFIARPRPWGSRPGFTLPRGPTEADQGRHPTSFAHLGPSERPDGARSPRCALVGLQRGLIRSRINTVLPPSRRSDGMRGAGVVRACVPPTLTAVLRTTPRDTLGEDSRRPGRLLPNNAHLTIKPADQRPPVR